MRLIDADALDARIYNDIPIRVFGSVAKMANMREIISQAPTIDAEPVRHGKWEEQNVDTDPEAIDTWQSARCSICKRYHTNPYLYSFNKFSYCPHCGAKMDGDAHAAD